MGEIPFSFEGGPDNFNLCAMRRRVKL
jgi:hypothetical protein